MSRFPFSWLSLILVFGVSTLTVNTAFAGPTPTPTASPTATPSGTPTLSPTASATPTPTPIPPPSICSDLAGTEFWGLCNAYCEALDCDGGRPNADERACESVLASFERRAGEGVEMPCVERVCTASGSWSGDFDQNGWIYPIHLEVPVASCLPRDVIDPAVTIGVSYPSFPCSGTWTVDSASGSEFEVTESGLGGTCFNGCLYAVTYDAEADALSLASRSPYCHIGAPDWSALLYRNSP